MSGRLVRPTVAVTAPLAGTVVSLEDVPDPVFASLVVGPGVAILPREPDVATGATRRVVAVAPCAGRVRTLYPHAVMIGLDVDRAVLVHLGLDTGQLEGVGFDVATSEGERVTAGQPLIGWSPEGVRAGGRSTLCPVVALRGGPEDVLQLVAPGEQVEEGQTLLLWS